MILDRKIIQNIIKKKEKLEHKVYFKKNAKGKKAAIFIKNIKLINLSYTLNNKAY